MKCPDFLIFKKSGHFLVFLYSIRREEVFLTGFKRNRGLIKKLPGKHWLVSVAFSDSLVLVDY